MYNNINVSISRRRTGANFSLTEAVRVLVKTFWVTDILYLYLELCLPPTQIKYLSTIGRRLSWNDPAASLSPSTRRFLIPFTRRLRGGSTVYIRNRVSTNNYEIFVLAWKKGTLVTVSAYTIHHIDGYYPDQNVILNGSYGRPIYHASSKCKC